MGQQFVAGGIFIDPKGQERFALVCPGVGEKPLVMGNSLTRYFIMIWRHAHLYRVEKDYSLTLVAASPVALQGGIGAPERVEPTTCWVETLQDIISLT
uniref:Uncharacterized protein n=1 Tax=Desulfobacca acetoxidans TaxID=60893 RepID=A0A7V6DPK3_9BACT